MTRQNERDLAELRRFGRSAEEIQGFIQDVARLIEAGLSLLPPPVQGSDEETFDATEAMRSRMENIKKCVRTLTPLNLTKIYLFGVDDKNSI